MASAHRSFLAPLAHAPDQRGYQVHVPFLFLPFLDAKAQDGKSESDAVVQGAALRRGCARWYREAARARGG